jgi:hypothetical protein
LKEFEGWVPLLKDAGVSSCRWLNNNPRDPRVKVKYWANAFGKISFVVEIQTELPQKPGNIPTDTKFKQLQEIIEQDVEEKIESDPSITEPDDLPSESELSQMDDTEIETRKINACKDIVAKREYLKDELSGEVPPCVTPVVGGKATFLTGKGINACYKIETVVNDEKKFKEKNG